MTNESKKRQAKSSKKPKQDVHFIESLKEVLVHHKNELITFGDIMSKLKEEGLIFLIAMISFPTAIPVPTPPGFTTLFGIPLCILTIQMVYRLDAPWLPAWLATKKLKVSTFNKFIDRAEPVFNKLSRFLKPRYQYFTTKSMERIVGILAFLCSLSIALPILFGNAIPSAGILIMSIGLLYKDGLTVFIGMVVSVIGLIIATIVVVLVSLLGLEVLEKLINTQLIEKIPF